MNREEALSGGMSSSFFAGKSWLFVAGISLIVLFILLLIVGNLQGTGKVSLGLETSYAAGEKLQGKINFGLTDAEFIPADSVVTLQLGNNSKSMALSELVGDNPVYGNFSAEGTVLNGSGEGYGGNESLSADISRFDISAEEGILSVKLVYGDIEIASAEQEIVIEQSAISGMNETLNETLNETVPEIPAANESL